MKWLIVLCAAEESEAAEQITQYRMIQRNCEEHGVAVEFVSYCWENNISDTAEAATLHILQRDNAENCEGILIAAGGFTQEIAGRIAASLGRKCLTDVHNIKWEEGAPLFYKAVYNHNMEAMFRLPQAFVAGLSKWRTEDAIHESGDFPQAGKIMPQSAEQFQYITDRVLKKAKERQIASRILIAAGKGIRSKKDMEKIRAYAKESGYLFGVTRPVAMNGWAAIDEIIGVSGHIYAPEICITVGISGSAAFYAGIENSRWIASVNIDKKAPIVKMSDVSVIDDYDNIWEQLVCH